MSEGVIFVLLLAIAAVQAAIYYHESSRIVISPPSLKPGSEFGFSMGFQDIEPKNLIVGAPRYDFIGKVYNCPIIDIDSRVECQLLDIDMEKLANYTRELNPDQKFYLGASIAATPDYFLTCAPTWTAKNVRGSSDAYGTCFIHQNMDNNFTRYHGLFERDRKESLMTSGGGIGWNTLYDNVNKLILIAKNSLSGDIVYMKSAFPTRATSSLAKLMSNSRDPALKYLYAQSNIGNGLAAGNFISNSTNYAFSMTSVKMNGEIAFIKPVGTETRRQFKIVKDKNDKWFTIKNEAIGYLFGAALHAEDLNGDGYSDLIVGAPGFYDDNERYDLGAVYIYIGGDMKIAEKSRMRVITATENGGRFGSAIATKDVDGDGLPEIFISAPYENSGAGAVYILSGHEVNKTLLARNTQQISLKELEFTQKLHAEKSRRFGYSLQVLSDIDNNGCNELAVGSPDSDEVILFRCLPAVDIEVNARLLGAEYVKEEADSFVVEVCVNIEYLPRPENVTGAFSETAKLQRSVSIKRTGVDPGLHELQEFFVSSLSYENKGSPKFTVKTDIEGDGAYIQHSTFLVNLSEKLSEQCANITVMLSDKVSGKYRFTAQAEVNVLNNDIMRSKDFKRTWLTVTEYSKTYSSIGFVRRCDDDCKPKLSASVRGPDVYLLGSSDEETVMVIVRNNGHESNDGCLKVRVVGAQVLRFGCPKENEEYYCTLKRLGRDKEQSLPIILNMTNPLSSDQKLHVEVDLYESCSQATYTTSLRDIPYQLTNEPILVKGSPRDRNVTDKQILDVDTQTINDGHEYEIINNGSVTWLNVTAVIAIEKRPYIGTYKGALTETNCNMSEDVDVVVFECNFILLPRSIKKGIASMEILKDKIVENLVNGKLNTKSRMTLIFEPYLPEKSDDVTTVFTYMQELSVLNNKYLIITGAILLALLILIIFIFILYKANFFKRKQKQRLNEFRESVRRQSVKKNNTEKGEETKNDADMPDIQVVECMSSDLQSSTTDDSAVLIETEAQVH